MVKSGVKTRYKPGPDSNNVRKSGVGSGTDEWFMVFQVASFPPVIGGGGGELESNLKWRPDHAGRRQTSGTPMILKCEKGRGLSPDPCSRSCVRLATFYERGAGGEGAAARPRPVAPACTVQESRPGACR